MLDQMLGTDVPLDKRPQFLRDNCDKVEMKKYNKQFSSQELSDKRLQLETVSINISDLKQQKKDYDDAYKIEMKPMEEIHKKTVQELKDRTVQVEENCYAFIDEESKMIGFYNGEGLLIYSRPLTVDELQKTVHMEVRRTGTHG